MKTIAELSIFLHDWYGECQGGLAVDDVEPAHPVAPPLMEMWQRLGRLCAGYDAWVRVGNPSPLACQDGLASPTGTRVRDGLVHFLFENQGNWSMAYRADDRSPDAEILSDIYELYSTGAGYQPTGTTLSLLLITSALTETAFFGSDPSNNVSGDLGASCTTPLWTGAYYPIDSFDTDNNPAPHCFSVNSDRTLLRADIDVGFGHIVANRNLARKRWRKLVAA